MSRFTVETVRALKGAPLSVYVALALAGMAVSNEWLVANTGYTGKPVAVALMYLREHGYVVLTASGWKLAGPEKQLPLGATPPDNGPADPEQAPLQAGEPLTAAGPDAPELRQADGNSASADPILIVLDDSLKGDSLKTNKNTGGPRRNNSVRLTENARHLADVTRALLRKGLPATAVDDPFPPDLRVAVERLVATVHMARGRAEEVVSRSPWAAPKIIEQGEIWAAYKLSRHGANLTEQFPWLVAARIEQGQECPFDTRSDSAAGDRYDGYLEYTQPSDDPQESTQ